MLLLALYVAFALGVSFLCSLLEACLLASRNAVLAEQAGQGSRGSARLLELKRGRIDDAISAILVVNTISNTLGATMAGAQAGRVFQDPWVAVFSGILTFLILIVSEIVPKTLGTVYAAQLSGFVGWTLLGLVRAMAPVLFVTGGLTRLLTRGKTTVVSLGELSAIVGTARRQGTVSVEQAEMFENLLRFDEVQVEDVMTPRTVTFVLSEEATIADLLGERKGKPFSRVPLYRGDPDNIVGYVLLDDILRDVADHGSRDKSLKEFRREISFLPELATVGSALSRMIREREQVAMVTDEHGSIAGLITMEDLTETVLGAEIVDESDRHVDLREAATRLRDRRLERLRRTGRLDSTGSDQGGQTTD